MEFDQDGMNRTVWKLEQELRKSEDFGSHFYRKCEWLGRECAELRDDLKTAQTQRDNYKARWIRDVSLRLGIVMMFLAAHWAVILWLWRQS